MSVVAMSSSYGTGSILSTNGLLTARFTNPPVPRFTAFAWYNSCEGKNGHIPSMRERPLGAIASVNRETGGLVNRAVKCHVVGQTLIHVVVNILVVNDRFTTERSWKMKSSPPKCDNLLGFILIYNPRLSHTAPS